MLLDSVLVCWRSNMRKLYPSVKALLVVVSVASVLGCGSSRKLKSIIINPATADAQQYPGGQVQFTASGTYTDGSKVNPLPVKWSGGQPWTQMPWIIQLDSNGLASCGNAQSGVYNVFATAPLDPSSPVSQMNMSTPQLTATAQLTCP